MFPELQAPLIVGMMSGTSVDGIDVAIVRMAEKPQLAHFSESPMPGELRERILRLAEPGADGIDAMGELDRALGEAFAQAALLAIGNAGLAPADIAAIGCHGQTVRHRPRAKHPFTLQIGCPSTIAEISGITTVADFRRRDLAAGGCGAPLAPFAHRLLFAGGRESIAVVNIGGIANLTFLPAAGGAAGFDTGPGNMIMDGLMLSISGGGQGLDINGRMAAGGTVCQPLLRELLSHPFLSRRPPKSTGREDFGGEIVHRILGWPGISDTDRLATAAELTARGIADSRNFLPEVPGDWYVCGGGAANPHLMRRLSALLAPAGVRSTEALGVPPAAVEAVCFAILAHHCLCGLVNTLPVVTGAAHGSVGGHIAPGGNWHQLLRAIPAWTR